MTRTPLFFVVNIATRASSSQLLFFMTRPHQAAASEEIYCADLSSPDSLPIFHRDADLITDSSSATTLEPITISFEKEPKRFVICTRALIALSALKTFTRSLCDAMPLPNNPSHDSSTNWPDRV